MSRHSPYQTPWLRPQAVRLWKQFRKEHEENFRDGQEKIQQDGGKYMPESLYFNTSYFTSYRDRQPPIDWNGEEADTIWGRQKVPTARWEVDGLRVVVHQLPYELDDYSTYGKFTSKEEPCYYGETWGTLFFREPLLKKQLAEALIKNAKLYDLKREQLDKVWETLKKELQKNETPKLRKKTLQGPNSRHSWRTGTYDRFEGEENPRGRRGELRYIQLADYDYDDLRKHYWLAGRSKRESDELARQEFRARVKFMEAIGKGEIQETYIVAKVYDVRDEDEEDELGSDGTSTTIDPSSSCKINQRWIDNLAQEVARNALSAARKAAACDELQSALPGVQ